MAAASRSRLASERLQRALEQKLEAVRRALEDDYEVVFELLTTGALTDAAKADLKVFADKLEESDDLSASLQLVDSDVLETRLAEAEAQELPSLDHVISIDPDKTLIASLSGTQTVITALSLRECLNSRALRTGGCFARTFGNGSGTTTKSIGHYARRSMVSGRRILFLP